MIDAKVAAAYGQTLQEMYEKSLKGDREAWLDLMREIRYYGYSRNYDERYYKPLSEYMADDCFRAKVNRTAEYCDVVGSFLFPQIPSATVNSKEFATYWQRQRHEWEAEALNLFLEKGDFATHVRRDIREALIGGRGILWIGYNDQEKMPQAVFDTAENFGGDPNARTPEEVTFVWRKRRQPRWQLRQRIELIAEYHQQTETQAPPAAPAMPSQPGMAPDPAEAQGQDGCYADPDAVSGIPQGNTDEKGDLGDCVEYLEIYTRVGLNHFMEDQQGRVLQAQGKVEYDESPKLYLVTVEGTLLACTSWPIPFFKINKWPCFLLDLKEKPGHTYPQPPLEAALSHLRAMNWLYTAYINRVMKTARLTHVQVDFKGGKIEDDAFSSIVGGDGTPDVGAIRIKVPPTMESPDVRQLFQQLKLDTGMDEFPQMWATVNRLFEDSSGLTDMLRSGQDERQIRTAEDAELKGQRSMSRIDDLKKVLERHLSDVMGGLAFAARILVAPEDMGKWFGPPAAKAWGQLTDDPMQAQQEQMMRMQLGTNIARQAMMGAQQAQMHGMPAPPLPTQDQIEQQIGPPQLVLMDDWINEATREILSGSLQPLDHDAQIQNLNFFFQSAAPLVAQMPAGHTVLAAFVREFTHLHRYRPELQTVVSQWMETVDKVDSMLVAGAMNPQPPGPNGQQGPNSQPHGQAPPGKPKPQPPQGATQAAMGQHQ